MNLKHDKEAVLKKGLSLFCDKGYNSLGIDEICKVTGMTKGAFYHAFKSKELFLKEAILLYSKNNVKRIKAQLEPTKKQSAFKRLQTFYTNMLQAQPKVNFTGCFINNTMSELGFANKPIGKISHEALNEFLDAIEPTVKEAQKNGEIKKDLNAKKTTELLHTTFYGALTIAKSSQNHKQSISIMNLLFQNLKTKKNG